MNYTEYKNFKENTTHGNTMLPFVKYFSSIPSFFPFYPLHWHEEVEIIYIKKGCGTVSVNLNQHPVTIGDFILINPGSLHSIGQFKTEEMDYDTLVFHTNMLTSYPPDACSLQYLTPLLHNECFLPTVVHPEDGEYSELKVYVEALIGLYDEKKEGYELEIKAYLFLLLHMLFSKHKIRFGQKNTYSDTVVDKLKQIVKYIDDNYQKELCINDMAELCSFSPSHFMKFFKTHMGMTFTEYLNDYRLVIASQLLVSTDLAILNVALECGYENLSYFNRVFKKKFQETPRMFRKQKQPLNIEL